MSLYRTLSSISSDGVSVEERIAMSSKTHYSNMDTITIRSGCISPTVDIIPALEHMSSFNQMQVSTFFVVIRLNVQLSGIREA